MKWIDFKRASLKLLNGLWVAILCMQGCATLVCGTKQRVKVDTFPPGARVLVNGTEHGQTPLTVKLERRLVAHEPVVIRLEQPGHEPQDFMIRKGITPWYDRNWATAGVLGAWVDRKTGSVYQATPSTVMAYLQPIGSGGVSVQRSGAVRGTRPFRVHLKDGSMLWGVHLETDASGNYQIKLTDGSTVRYPADQVRSIEPVQ